MVKPSTPVEPTDDAPKRRPKFEARRQEIVDIAARIFAERGYDATSLDDLCEATGLQRGGLYHYIGSKEDLLFRIHERFIAPLLEEARRIEAQGDDPVSTLRALAHALMSDIAEYRDQVTVFLHESRTVSRRKDERSAAVMAARREFEDVIDRTLQRGVADGLFNIAHPRLALLGFLGMFNYSYQWYRPGHSVSPDEVADAFVGVFLDGIRAR